MPWSLKSGSDIVAELGPELPQGSPDTRSWPILPTPAFERIRPVVDATAAVRLSSLRPMPESISGIADDEERARAIQHWFKTDSGVQLMLAQRERKRALDLAIVDESGERVEAGEVQIAELPGLPNMPFEPWMRPDFERAGFRGDPPFYIAVASRIEHTFTKP